MRSEVWSSKWVFILAAVGAAAGLGNLWRFPYMVYEHGGGAFLLAYLLILFGFGIPLVIMEVAFGQKSQTDVVSAFGNIGGYWGRVVGWLLFFTVALIGGYYAIIIAWGFDYLAVAPVLAWGADAQTYFHQHILYLSDSVLNFGGFSKPVIYGLIATYISVYFSIFKGLKSVGAVVKWTVPLPFILLFIILLNTLTLPGAMEGFKYFLLPDWSQLRDTALWKDALSQAFFSMNIGFGLTIMYAAFNKKKQNIAQSGLLIALGDTAVSLVAGFAIFGTLGWMSQSQGIPIQDVVTSGFSLAFVTFPTALALLPVGGAFFAVLFFLSILTLAIDSMFAMIELAVSILRHQFDKLKDMPQKKAVAFICGVFFLFSLVFAGGNGLYRLDIMDHFVVGHAFYISIIAQLLLIGWALPIRKLRQAVKETSGVNLTIVFDLLVKFIAPAVFIFFYYEGLKAEFADLYGGYPLESLLAWGVFPVGLAIFSALLLAFPTRR